MQRRQFLAGTAATLPLLTGCMSLLGGGSVIDASNLATYTSNKYGYSVKYPSEWSKSKDGSSIKFVPESKESIMISQCIPGEIISMTRDEYMNIIIQSFKKKSEEFSTSNERTTELPNGYTGKALTMTATIEAGDGLGTAKGELIFASNNKRIYDAMVFVNEDDYEATKPAMEEIIGSLTIMK